MAQKVTVALEDDLDGGLADETVRFRFDGTDYEIDLSGKNRPVLPQAARPVHRARPQGRPRTGTPGRADGGRPSAQWRHPRVGARAAPQSASAGGSRSAWWSSTRPLLEDADPRAPPL